MPSELVALKSPGPPNADPGIEHRRKLKATAPQHPFALDLSDQSAAFDDAAAKFSIAA